MYPIHTGFHVFVECHDRYIDGEWRRWEVYLCAVQAVGWELGWSCGFGYHCEVGVHSYGLESFTGCAWYMSIY